MNDSEKDNAMRILEKCMARGIKLGFGWSRSDKPEKQLFVFPPENIERAEFVKKNKKLLKQVLMNKESLLEILTDEDNRLEGVNSMDA